MAVSTPESRSHPLSLWRYRGTNQCWHEDLGKGVRLTMMLIPEGSLELKKLGEDRSDAAVRKLKCGQLLMGRFPVNCRSTSRHVYYRDLRNDSFGFCVVCESPRIPSA